MAKIQKINDIYPPSMTVFQWFFINFHNAVRRTSDTPQKHTNPQTATRLRLRIFIYFFKH